jgi:hypothetical protein
MQSIVVPESTNTAWRPPTGKIKILFKGKRRKLYGEGMHFLTWWERFMSSRLCGHRWSFPITLKDHSYGIKVAAHGGQPAYDYDSHQTCTRCGDHRLFSTKIWAPGPMFRRLVVHQPSIQPKETA